MAYAVAGFLVDFCQDLFAQSGAYEGCATPGIPPGFEIGCVVAYHDRTREVDVVFTGGAQDHARRGFAAGAVVFSVGVMGAVVDGVDGCVVRG